MGTYLPPCVFAALALLAPGPQSHMKLGTRGPTFVWIWGPRVPKVGGGGGGCPHCHTTHDTRLYIYICVTLTLRSIVPPGTLYCIKYLLAVALYKCETKKFNYCKK